MHNEFTLFNHETEEAKNYTIISWTLGNVCNYSCSYCPVRLNDGSAQWASFDIVTEFIDVCSEHFDKKLYFEFPGGEITVWKNFIKCSEYIKEKKHKVGFLTNASRTMRWWNDNKDLFDQVILSFHSERVSIDHFLKVTELMSRSCHTHVVIMMHWTESLWQKCLNFINEVIKIKNISVSFKPIRIDFSPQFYPYTNEQLSYMKNQNEVVKDIICDENFIRNNYRGNMIFSNANESKLVRANDLVLNGENNWTGWNCWAGLDSIKIDYFGNIHRSWCKIEPPFGNIHKLNEIKWPHTPVLCNVAACRCNVDICTRKENI